MSLTLLFRSHYCRLFTGLVAAMIITGACSAQQKTADSLLSILNKHVKEDTVRLNLLNKLAFIEREKPTDPYVDMAISLAKQLNQEHALADAYFTKGKYYFNNVQFKINLDYIKSYQKGKGGYVALTDNTSLEVSTRRKDLFLKKMEEM